MRRALAPLAALIACLMLTACGIGPTGVIADRAVQGDAGETGAGNTPSKRVRVSKPQDLVQLYLRAAAADYAKRPDLMKTYFADDYPGPKTDGPASVSVIRMSGESAPSVRQSDGSELVTIQARRIGTLLDISGKLVPTVRSEESFTFRVIDKGDGYVFSQVPSELLLAETALPDLFKAYPLYFPATAGTTNWVSGTNWIQDIRYVPNGLSLAQVSEKLVQWLYDSPSEWLRSSVSWPSNDTRPKDAVVVEGSTITVNLVSKPADTERLKEELARTLLQPNFGLRITVSAQDLVPRYTLDSPTRSMPPLSYAVANGTVYRLKTQGSEAGSKFLDSPAAAGLNKFVQSVAVSRDEQTVAFVRSESAGGPQKLVVLKGSEVIPIGDLLPQGRPVSQPVWLRDGRRDDRMLLVQVDDTIYQLDVAEKRIVAKSQIRGLSQFSVAPDGVRLSLVIDGQLYLASRSDTGVGVENKQLVPTGFDTVQSAAFRDTRDTDLLIVAGNQHDSVSLATMHFDGTTRIGYEPRYPVGSVIRHLVAKSGRAFYEVQGQAEAFEAIQSGAQPVSPTIDWAGAQLPQPVQVHAPSFGG